MMTEELDLCEADLSDLDGLQHQAWLQNVRTLRLDKNHISSLGSLHLHTIPQLSQLSLAYNSIQHLAPLSECTLSKLSTLNLAYNQISDLDELYHLQANLLPALTSISLQGNPLPASYRTLLLQQLPSLRVIDGIPVERQRITASPPPTPAVDIDRLNNADYLASVLQSSGSMAFSRTDLSPSDNSHYLPTSYDSQPFFETDSPAVRPASPSHIPLRAASSAQTTAAVPSSTGLSQPYIPALASPRLPSPTTIHPTVPATAFTAFTASQPPHSPSRSPTQHMNIPPVTSSSSHSAADPLPVRQSIPHATSSSAPASTYFLVPVSPFAPTQPPVSNVLPAYTPSYISTYQPLTTAAPSQSAPLGHTVSQSQPHLPCSSSSASNDVAFPLAEPMPSMATVASQTVDAVPSFVPAQTGLSSASSELFTMPTTKPASPTPVTATAETAVSVDRILELERALHAAQHTLQEQKASLDQLRQQKPLPASASPWPQSPNARSIANATPTTATGPIALRVDSQTTPPTIDRASSPVPALAARPVDGVRSVSVQSSSELEEAQPLPPVLQVNESSEWRERASLLQVRLESARKIMKTQEDMIRELSNLLPASAIPDPLTKWREKTFALLVQQKADELAVGQLKKQHLHQMNELRSQLALARRELDVTARLQEAHTAELMAETSRRRNVEEALRQSQLRISELSAALHQQQSAARLGQQFVELCQKETVKFAELGSQVQRRVAVLDHRLHFASGRLRVLRELKLAPDAGNTKPALLSTPAILPRLPKIDELNDPVTLRGLVDSLRAETQKLTTERDSLAHRIAITTQRQREQDLAWEQRLATISAEKDQQIVHLHEQLNQCRAMLHQAQEEIQAGQASWGSAKQDIQQLVRQLTQEQRRCSEAVHVAQSLQQQIVELEAELSHRHSEHEMVRKENTKTVIALRQLQRELAREKQRNASQQRPLDELEEYGIRRRSKPTAARRRDDRESIPSEAPRARSPRALAHGASETSRASSPRPLVALSPLDQNRPAAESPRSREHEKNAASPRVHSPRNRSAEPVRIRARPVFTAASFHPTGAADKQFPLLDP